MKKFLIYLVVILVAVATGFTVFYLTRNNEVISITTSSVYMKEGEKFKDLSINWKNKKAFSDYEVFSSDEKVAKYDKDNKTLTAVDGGIATITFRTSNIKFRNLSCQVYVGDGTLSNPYYISTVDQFKGIGQAREINGVKTAEYGLDKCYKLVANLDLRDGYDKTGFWLPVGIDSANGFTGNFNGNGYTISNIAINREQYLEETKNLKDDERETLYTSYGTFTNAGLFSKIGPNGVVRNVKLDNLTFRGKFDYNGSLGNVGAVAGVSYGLVERVELLNGHFDVSGTDTVGGLVGLNKSVGAMIGFTNENGTTSSEYVRFTAKVTRSNAKITMGISKEIDPEKPPVISGVGYNVGGIAGANIGGILTYNYALGDVYLNSSTGFYGGIVGNNNYADYSADKSKYENIYAYDYSGAHVKDNYSVVNLRKSENIGSETSVGGIIGINTDRPILEEIVSGSTDKKPIGEVNKVIGNYYLKEALNFVEPVVEVKEGEENPSVPTVEFKGIGKNVFVRENSDDTKITMPDDKEYVVQGKLALELKNKTTFISNVRKEKIYNEDTKEYEEHTITTPWLFDTVWFIDGVTNNGYPYLNFANIEVDDGIVGGPEESIIGTYADLCKMKLDGNYFISTNIVAPDDAIWTPIGSIKTPFKGNLRAGSYIKNGEIRYYTISNLKTSSSKDLETVIPGSLDNAGLFAYLSGGTIENITLVNPTFINGVVTGGIAANNGYITQSGNQQKVVVGSTIKNCKVLGGTLRATEAVGGIAGNNYGQISGSIVSDSADEFLNVTKSDVILYSAGAGNLGGIAGFNGSSVSNVRVNGQVTIIAKSGKDSVANVNVGGIVGDNVGTVSNAFISNIGGVSIDEINGAVGGIAGLNRGGIENAIVSTSVYVGTNSDKNYAGGIAGKLIEESYVNNSLVRKSAVTGYFAGGIAGYVNYSKVDYFYDFTIDAKTFEYKISKDRNTIDGCGVDDTGVTGDLSGGFAAVMDNGIIYNSYTKATLSGIDSKSIKAGFVAQLNSTKNTAGFIFKSYSNASFSAGNGTNYAVTTNEIYLNPTNLFGLADKVPGYQRNAGYAFEYVFNTDAGGKEPTIDKFLWIPTNGSANKLLNNAKAKSSEMKGTNPSKFTNVGFLNSVWRFVDNNTPELIALNNLVNSSGITF